MYWLLALETGSWWPRPDVFLGLAFSSFLDDVVYVLSPSYASVSRKLTLVEFSQVCEYQYFCLVRRGAAVEILTSISDQANSVPVRLPGALRTY